MEVLNAQLFSDQTDGPPHAGPKNMQIVLVKRHRSLLCVLFVVASLIFSFDSVRLDLYVAAAAVAATAHHFAACIVFICAVEPPSIIELHFD